MCWFQGQFDCTSWWCVFRTAHHKRRWRDTMWEARDKEVIWGPRRNVVRGGPNKSCCTCDKLNLCSQLVRQCSLFQFLMTVCSIPTYIYIKKEKKECKTWKENHGYKLINQKYCETNKLASSEEQETSQCGIWDYTCTSGGPFRRTTAAQLKHWPVSWDILSQIIELHEAPANNLPYMYTTRARGLHTQLPARAVPSASHESRWLLRRVINKSRHGRPRVVGYFKI